MTNTKSTKRALLASVMAMLLCFTMLLGTTFAWFTDSVTVSGNKIQAGTLDIALYEVEPNPLFFINGGDPVNVIGEITNDSDPLFAEDIRWEPGYTAISNLKLVNNGNLALKWQVTIHPTTEIGELAKVIDVYATEALIAGRTSVKEDMKIGTLADVMKGTVLLDGTMLPNDDSNYDSLFFSIVLKMQESADNEYQGKTAGAFDIRILATQNTYESDSFNNTYDKDSTYPVFVNNATELTNALENAKAGTVITLSEDVDYGTVTVSELKDVVIKGAEDSPVIFKTDANSKIENVTLQEVEFKYTGANVDSGVVIDANAQIDNLVIEGCTFTGDGSKAGRGLSGANNNASIVLKNCTFKDLGYPIYVWGSYESLTIEGCTFDNIQSWAIMPQSGFDGDLTVTGCTFQNCLGGGLIKAGTLTAGHTFTFTNNTVTGCSIAGDHNWFQFNVSAGDTVISGNTKDGAEWIPGVVDGLK